jgi:pyruvate kinase
MISGSSILREAAARPLVPIIAATPYIRTARYLQMVWGVEPVLIPPEVEGSPTAFKSMMTNACVRSVELGFINKTDNIVLTAGLPFGLNAETTNFLRVMTGEGPVTYSGVSGEGVRDDGDSMHNH